MKLIVLENTDRWHPHHPLNRLGIKILQLLQQWEVRWDRFLHPREACVILGPHSLSAKFSRYGTFYDYPTEEARNDWSLIREQAKTLFSLISRALDPVWKTESEKLSWRAVRPWMVHKLMYRHLGHEAAVARIIAGHSAAAGSVIVTYPPLSGSIGSWLDWFFDKREKRKYWSQQIRHAGTRKGLPGFKVQALLLSSGLYSPRMCLPLSQALTNAKIPHHILAVSSEQPWPYDGRPIPPDASWSYIFSHTDPQTLSSRHDQLSSRARQITSGLNLNAFSSLEVSDSRKDLLLSELKVFLTEDWVQAQCFYDAVRQFVDQFGARMVVCSKHLRVLEGAVIELAHQNDLPVLFIDYNTPVLLDFLDVDPRDYVAVSNPQLIEPFIKLGAQRDHLHPVGDLRLEETRIRTQTTSKKPSDQLQILALSGVATEKAARLELKAFYQALINLQQTIPRVSLTLKLHPKQSTQIFEREIVEWGLQGLRWVHAENLYELIGRNSLVIAQPSLAVTEAMFMDKPVIIHLESWDKNKLIPLSKEYPFLLDHYAIRSFSADDLITLVKRFLNEPEFQNTVLDRSTRFRQEHLYRSDKSSATVAAELVESLITQSSK